ncbi:hypothetical protein PPYC1_06580 [Paenibacillus polymyxa]|nr:hypothetical protein PPYC1_06580 [Paenibacillus polymyxa]
MEFASRYFLKSEYGWHDKKIDNLVKLGVIKTMFDGSRKRILKESAEKHLQYEKMILKDYISIYDFLMLLVTP